MISCNSEPFPINLAFLGLDVLGVQLKKSDEWLYGVYRDNQLLGYLYEGGQMTKEIQDKYAKQLIPEKLNTLSYFISKYQNKVGYYRSRADSFVFVGIEDKIN